MGARGVSHEFARSWGTGVEPMSDPKNGKTAKRFDSAPRPGPAAPTRPTRLGLVRKSTDWSTGPLVATVVVLVLLSGAAPVLGGGTATGRATRSSSASEGGALLEQAAASLKDGMGPAEGGTMTCAPSGSGAQCSSVPGANGSGSSAAYSATTNLVNFTSPSARYGAPWAYDGNATQPFLLMFGGANSSGKVFGQTWELTSPGFGLSTNVTARNWTNLSSSSCGVDHLPCPPARHDPVLGYDYKDGYFVLFGGCTAIGGWTQSLPGCPIGDAIGDTWIWNTTTRHWAELNISGPPARYAASMAYDAATRSLLLFGGCGATCPMNDTWSFSHGAWTQLHPSPAPSPRYGASLFWNTASSADVLFGGCGSSVAGCSSSALYRDTWNFSRGNWSQQHPSVSPSARLFAESFGLVYPAFTGYTNALCYGSTGILSGSLSDCWVWTGTGWLPSTGTGCIPLMAVPTGVAARFDGNLWSRICGGVPDVWEQFGGTSMSGSSLGDTDFQTFFPVPVSTIWPPPLPSARYGASMSYDPTSSPSSSVVVLFGGCASSCPSNETWLFGNCTGLSSGPIPPSACPLGGPTWYQIHPACPCPLPRFDASMAYDQAIGDTLLFGGIGGNGSLLNDTWTLTHSAFSPAFNWAAVTCTGSCPARRLGATLNFDRGVRGGFGADILFGGNGSSGIGLSDTWEFYSGAWHQLSFSTHPPGRAFAAAAFDAFDSYLVLFGGVSGSGSRQDTWKLTNTPSWVNITPSACTSSNCPQASFGIGMDYDTSSAYLLLLTYGSSSSATWAFSGGSWTPLTSSLVCHPACPSPIRDYSVVYASAFSSVAVLAGLSVGAQGLSLGTFWLFGNSTWTREVAPCPLPAVVSPPARAGAAMAFDPAYNEIVLVEGCSLYCTTSIGGTWSYQNGHWTELPVVASPFGALLFPSLAFDPAGPQLILFGGLTLPGLVQGETWMFTGGGWSLLHIADPSPRYDAPMAFDPTLNEMVLFGGCASGTLTTWDGCSSPLSDTWLFNGGGWSIYSGSHPPVSSGGAMVYDPSSSAMVLVDGSNASGPISQEWLFTGSWVSHSPPPFTARYDASETWNAQEGVVVLFGGITVVNSTGVLLNDTWNENAGSWTQTSGFPGGGRGAAAMTFDPLAGADGRTVMFGGWNSVVGGPFVPGQGDTWDFEGSAGWVEISYVA
jgi:type II secretory pathway pseudopilin PulG